MNNTDNVMNSKVDALAAKIDDSRYQNTEKQLLVYQKRNLRRNDERILLGLVCRRIAKKLGTGKLRRHLGLLSKRGREENKIVSVV
jgi:hypothetical protein